jgi:two-component system, OmpR family, KDP operon response regulator KdpE
MAKKRILVVDDEADILFFVDIGLKAAGYEVSTAGGGVDALALARAQPFDLILLDMVMSPMGGIEVLDTVRGFSDIPVIASTARSELGELALQHGATAALKEPFMPEELTGLINRILKAPSK